MDECVAVPAGAAKAVLKVGRCSGGGCRTYLAFAGGLRVPDYLGSKSTFTLGKFGGPTGRALQTGDMLHLDNAAATSPSSTDITPPKWEQHWNVRVLYGPHGAPDFFTNDDIEMFFATHWKVHYNSNPTGIRLIGPKPKWARPDGGEAGLHPSNIHDNAYAVGTVDFTGDMPIILGPDGPSLGGFVCPATIIRADRWMMGQFKPGDTVRFVPVTLADAESAEKELTRCIASPRYPAPIVTTAKKVIATLLSSPVLRHSPATHKQVEVKYRQSGDKYLLIEYGPPVLGP